MAQLKCPQCDTGHELDDALFMGAPRRVRCASCRHVWTASSSDLLPSADSPIAVAAPVAAPQSQDDIDSLFDVPLKQADSAPQSQDDIDSLFGPAADDKPQSQGDIDSLFAEPVKAEVAKPEPAPIIVPSPVEVPDDAAERRSERRRRLAESERAKPLAPPPTQSKAKSLAVVLAAASIGTFATLLIFRHDVATLAPWSVPLYESIGLGLADKGLFFEDVRSRIIREDGRETLEVTGVIHNRTAHRQLMPMLRLAVRSEAGQEIFVWTATADQADIGPNDKLRFRRRLASPPPESHDVEVRFVGKNDVVASVR